MNVGGNIARTLTRDVELTQQVVLGHKLFHVFLDVFIELAGPRSAGSSWLNDLRDTPRARMDR